MGKTFVTLSHEMAGTEPGFWVNDSMLELWLRLLALHLPDPRYHDNPQMVTALRDHWLGSCGACVSHGMEDACATPEGRAVVREAIDALLPSLKNISTPLDAGTLDLLGTGTGWVNIERRWLVDIGHAFIDLLDGKITRPLPATEVMPGSKPYHRA